jgi:hypothetical protein
VSTESLTAQLARADAEISFLRQELERKDAIIMALTGRIPELMGSREPRGGPETATEEQEKGGR